ncbi:hypothetical protein KL933_001712 [Ogataea haglerorum]|uniref:Protein kinase domain-containing protein n=1 Tax=Ogataea haglerorum TaxID=1937702 RepID=A0AAN6D6L8_9ASCO|nr:hypothetical protein KL915_001442 [Ogataea haglerorum]KAG7728479.1 hypothetical protein KL933_001712 [Ogataea haglerorum]KAG7733792.1 hypothetical protein KL948_000994 [Ogataea haglerorum]KAG7741021.1 hypothetical protein KL923_001662 [Ogataea haglerorum]KAG7759847.1 hypothetical protein KL947_001477 [Ogataea haglerorum]
MSYKKGKPVLELFRETDDDNDNYTDEFETAELITTTRKFLVQQYEIDNALKVINPNNVHHNNRRSSTLGQQTGTKEQKMGIRSTNSQSHRNAYSYPDGIQRADQNNRPSYLNINTYGMSDLSPEEFAKYTKLKHVGRGAYGGVYQAKHVETGEIYAMKVIELDHTHSDSCSRNDVAVSDNQHLMNEILIMKQFDHVNVVKLFHYHLNEMSMNLVLEYCEGGSLRDRYRAKGPLPEHEVIGYIKQTLEGLVYLHKKRFIHSDIKAANILLKNGVIKLADFGVSIKIDAKDDIETLKNKKKEANGSPYWMAPEVIRLQGVSTASDIWSLGATVVELLTTQPPFYQHDPFPACHAIGSGEPPDIPSGISRECFQFLTVGCFQQDRKARLSAEQLLRHPWTQGEIKQEELHKTSLNRENRTGFLKQYNETFQDNYDNDFEERSINLLMTINTMNKKQRLEIYKESMSGESEDDFMDVFEIDHFKDLDVGNQKDIDMRQQKRTYIRDLVDRTEEATLEELQLIYKFVTEDDECGQEGEKLHGGSNFVIKCLIDQKFVYKLTSRLLTEESDDCKIELMKIAVQLFQHDTQSMVTFYHCGCTSRIIQAYHEEESVFTYLSMLVKSNLPTLSLISTDICEVLVLTLKNGDTSRQNLCVELLLELFRNEKIEKQGMSSILVTHSVPRLLAISLSNIRGHMSETQLAVAVRTVKLLAKVAHYCSDNLRGKFFTGDFFTCLFRRFAKLPLESKLEMVRIVNKCEMFLDGALEDLDNSQIQQIFDQLLEDLSSEECSKVYERFVKCTIPILQKLCTLDSSRQVDLLSTSSIELFNHLLKLFTNSKRNETIKNQVVDIFATAAGNPKLSQVCKRYGAIEILINVIDDPHYRLTAIRNIRNLVETEGDILDEALKRKPLLLNKIVAGIKLENDLDHFFIEFIQVLEKHRDKWVQSNRKHTQSFSIYNYMCSSEEILNSLFERLSQPELVDPLLVLQLFQVLYSRTPRSFVLREFQPAFQDLRNELLKPVGGSDARKDRMIDIIDDILIEG